MSIEFAPQFSLPSLFLVPRLSSLFLASTYRVCLVHGPIEYGIDFQFIEFVLDYQVIEYLRYSVTIEYLKTISAYRVCVN